MSLSLGQLIYTSFAEVGFRTLKSAGVPSEVQCAFVEKIVYQSWDSYSPPRSGYRAVYLHQISSTQTLWGWLYNDGADDLGRSHVPYFVCYYRTGSLQAAQLRQIFTCLHQGPVTLADRHHPPAAIDPVVIPLQDYSSVYPGVAVPAAVQAQSDRSLKQGKLLNLFVSIDDVEETPDRVESMLRPLTSSADLAATTGGLNVNAPADPPFGKFNQLPQTTPSSVSPQRPGAEGYSQMLLARARMNQTSDRNQHSCPRRLLKLGITGIPVLLAVAIGSFYLLRVFSFTSAVEQSTRSVPAQPIVQAPAQTRTLAMTKTLAGHSDAVWSVLLTSDRQRLISGSADQTIKVWDLSTGQVLGTLAGHTEAIRSMDLSADGRTLVSGAGDNTIKIWDLQTNTLIATLTNHISPVWSVDISPDGKTLVSGSNDGTVIVWHLQTGQPLRTIPSHADCVFAAVISPDGRTLATGSKDSTIKLWDLQTGDLLRTISYHSSDVRSLAFSPDGRTLASGSWDQTVTLWDLQTGKLLHTLTEHTARVVTVAFSADGQTLISGSIDHTIKRWNVYTGAVLQTITNSSDWVLTIATDADRLVSGSKDKMIRIWQ